MAIPPPKRSPVRRAARAALVAATFLLAGAVVSVGVAVGFAFWGVPTAGVVVYGQVAGGHLVGEPNEDYRGTATRGQVAPEPIPLDVLPRNGSVSHEVLTGPGMTERVLAWCVTPGFVGPGSYRGNGSVRMRYRTGWPWRAMEYRRNEFGPDLCGCEGGWTVPDWLSRQSSFGGWSPAPGASRRLVLSRQLSFTSSGWVRPPVPFRPIPFGLAANSAFYGGILFALFALLGAGRRALRRHRNLCPSCGYSREGLVPGAACPECGSEDGAGRRAG